MTLAATEEKCVECRRTLDPSRKPEECWFRKTTRTIREVCPRCVQRAKARGEVQEQGGAAISSASTL